MIKINLFDSNSEIWNKENINVEKIKGFVLVLKDSENPAAAVGLPRKTRRRTPDNWGSMFLKLSKISAKLK